MSDLHATDYRAFLEAKIPMAQRAGLPCSLDDVPMELVDGQPLRDHQRHIVRWAVEGGRRALFEAFGLGKSIQQLLICDIILDKVEADPEREPGAPNMGLIVAPLGAEKHVCPLQFDIVDRLIERFSMKGELVFDPFAGLGTVPMRAISLGRRGAGSELNPDYFRAAAGYLREAEREAAVPTLFDLLGAEKAA